MLLLSENKILFVVIVDVLLFEELLGIFDKFYGLCVLWKYDVFVEDFIVNLFMFSFLILIVCVFFNLEMMVVL